MLWIYRRGSESLHLETRFDSEAEEYVLIVYREDGIKETERFKHADSFQTRLVALETQLDGEKWQSDGVKLLRDGWKI